MNRQALNRTISRGALGLAICAYLAFVSLEAGLPSMRFGCLTRCQRIS